MFSFASRAQKSPLNGGRERGNDGCYNRRTPDLEQEMKRIIALSILVSIGGCASAPQATQSDFTYKDISDYGGVGVRATSLSAGVAIDISASCIEGDIHYSIRPILTEPYMAADKRWSLNMDGARFWRSSADFDSEALFRSSLATLEAVSPPALFGSSQRVKISNSQIDAIPDLCRKKHGEHLTHARSLADKDRAKDEQLISEVVGRTGVQPMLTGKNQMSFNNIISLLQESGVSKHKGKFIWVSDGDYRIAQVVGKRVLLISMTNPGGFPAITIITDKEAMEGQFWSSVSQGPLELIGMSSYQTVLGAIRQTILFKSI